VFDSEKKAEDKLSPIKLLLANYANPNVANKHTGFTPIHWEARYGNVESISLLL
jgi:ankyrin repeat protein